MSRKVPMVMNGEDVRCLVITVPNLKENIKVEYNPFRAPGCATRDSWFELDRCPLDRTPSNVHLSLSTFGSSQLVKCSCFNRRGINNLRRTKIGLRPVGYWLLFYDLCME